MNMNEMNIAFAKAFPLIWTFSATPVIPALYWNVYSDEQRIKDMCELLWKSAAYSESIGGQFNSVQEAYEALLAEFEQFKQSGFADYYEDQVREWIAQNLDFIFTEVAKQVYFGLTTDGYFCAWIPQSWDEIVFDTGHVYTEDTYGRLILRWQVPAGTPDNTDQTPEVVR